MYTIALNRHIERDEKVLRNLLENQFTLLSFFQKNFTKVAKHLKCTKNLINYSI